MLKKIIFIIILISMPVDKAITSDDFDRNEMDLDVYSDYLKEWEGFRFIEG